jgi:two-component system CheB/CheR fusion protein
MENQPVKKPMPSAFPIVGVGASAGGLEAFMELFRTLPPDTGMAFVLVQHLSPQHLSLLGSLVQKATRMQVEEISDGTTVIPNHVYIIPPNALLEIFHGVLHLSPIVAPHGSSMPVNSFLTSLARDQGNLAIGMILSGTGSDGAFGLREIKADGGITLVQEPSTAKFDGMPKAAIAEAAPDFVLKIEEMASELMKIASHPVVRKPVVAEESEPSPENAEILQRIYILLRGATKVDFSNYKYPTIIRRIKRRMVLHRIDGLKHYLAHLKSKPDEVSALFEDLLINVTSFFRDADAFESLKSRAFPELLDGRSQGAAIRIWVPGCSTGEEVYSIAISLNEFLGDKVNQFPIQIYGTDICQSSIKISRTGIFPESAVKNISSERLKRFFVREQGGYRVTRVIRDCCIFSIQDVISQPPINRLDLLSCRNLMIYLGQSAQKKLMETFFYALNPNGFLMLGAAESLGSAVSLFAIVDKKNKIYVKKNSPTQIAREYLDAPPNAATVPSPPASETPLRVGLRPSNPVNDAERIVLNKFAPAWVLVNRTLDIVQFRGETDPYIAPASGQPTWNLMKMLRGGLSSDIRVLISSAMKDQKAVSRAGLKVTSGGVRRTLDVDAVPIDSAASEPHCLVVFKERVSERAKSGTPKKGSKKERAINLRNSENVRLQEELERTQQSLQSIIEDLNTTNEEMQSANEEVSSANEELQSTNEELETAKEELQSTNEELTTLNDELLSRNKDLDHLSNDLLNVLSNANVSIIMVGRDLRIRRFTPMAEKCLKLIAADIGRNLMDINLGFPMEKFDEKISQVINTLTTIEAETQDRQGHWYSVQIRPYQTVDNKVDGAVIVLMNVDEIKLREKQVLAAERFSDGIIQTVRDPLVVLRQDLTVERANQAFYDTFRVNREATFGRSFYELGNGQWDIPALRELLEKVLVEGLEVRDFTVAHNFEQIGKKEMILNARKLEWEGQQKLFLLISIHEYLEHGGRSAISVGMGINNA